MTKNIQNFIPGKISLQQLRRFNEGKHPISLIGGWEEAVNTSKTFLDRQLEAGKTIYGVNTGVGRFANVIIPEDDITTLQENIIHSHCTGVGAPIDEATTRLIMLLKASMLAQGFSGVRPDIIRHLVSFINQSVIPIIPSQGSVGASGDLVPLSHLARSFLGEGNVILNGKTLGAATAISKLKIENFKFERKEALSFINGTQVSTAYAIRALFMIECIFKGAIISGALSTLAVRGSLEPFHDHVSRLRGHVGQIDVAKELAELLTVAGSFDEHEVALRVQDPYSIRCQPQVMGAALDLIRFSATSIHVEVNAITDNPIVDTSHNKVLTGGNFHAQPIAYASDILALAIAEIGSISERRIALLNDGGISGLPYFLTNDDGMDSGFMMAHVTASALTSENKALTTPRSVDSIPTSANQEDHVSMATAAAARLYTMANNCSAILAIELLAAKRGLQLRSANTPNALSDIIESISAHAKHSEKTMDRNIHDLSNAILNGALNNFCKIDVI